MRKHVAIVTGVNSPIGKAYADGLSVLPNTSVVGTARSSISSAHWKAHSGVNLLSRAQVERFLDAVPIHTADDVTLVHTVGQFKFEDPPPSNGTLDPEVLASNLYTFENVVLGLISRLHTQTRARLSLCMLGSVSDVYEVPFWKSFTKSKNRMRALISRSIADHSNMTIKGLSIDVCSVDTSQSTPQLGRLTVPELIEKSLPEIQATIDVVRSEFRRINILRPAPGGFDWKQYYSDPEAIRKRWEKHHPLFD